MKNRLIEFDILKGIGILLVLIGHTAISSGVHHFIYSFHMPLFFFVSGFFFKKDRFFKYLGHKVFQLLVPWLFFAIVFSSYMFLVEGCQSHDWIDSLFHTLENIQRGLGGFENSYCYATIWFLICLFEISILYCFTNKVLNNILLETILYVGLYVVGYILHRRMMDLPYFLDTLLSIGIYYHGGFLCKKYDLLLKMKNFSFSIASLILCFCLILYLKPEVEYKGNIFPIYIAIIVIPLLFNMLTIIRLLKCKSVLLQKFGRDSLLIFGLHRPIYEALFALQSKLSMNNFILGIIQILLSLVCIELLSSFVYKYVPFLIGKNVTKS